MKDTYYFPHDFNPISDPKIQALIGEYGAIGYGVFWRLIEIMHESELHKIEHKKYVFIGIAKQMLTSVEQIESIVNDCINTYELFKSDEIFFWSIRVLRNIEKREEISKKRSKAGKLSAETRKNSTSVEQMLTSVEQIPTKESKGKEIKGNNIKEENNKEEIKPITFKFEKYLDDFKKERIQSERLFMNKKLSKCYINSAKSDFISQLSSDKSYESINDMIKHFDNWLNYQKKNNSNIYCTGI